MGVGFGGNPVFNRASPTSHDRCVQRIVEDYLPAKGGRVLDIGGTAAGFCSSTVVPPDVAVVIANPESGVGADYRFVSDIPPTVTGFDLAMLFGVMMYLQREPLISLMRDVRTRLRTYGTLLIAEPDPEGVVGRVEVAAKKVYAAIRSVWDPTKFTFHTKGETQGMLREAGYVKIRDRTDLTPNKMGVLPPPMPPYFAVAGSI